MDTATIQNVLSTNLNLLAAAAFKIISAIVIWFVGRKLIDIATGIDTLNLERA